ncbi:MAG: PAS domain S-box protein [Deltaproteobacteria bacterium]|nr:PAS domain S-box protein [Deltaproteobacteria bacterium]
MSSLKPYFRTKGELMKELGPLPRQAAFWEAGLHVQDITERNWAEEKLWESEERFRRVFQEGPIGMCIATPDFHFTKVNDAFCLMLGYSSRELALLTFKDITHPEHLNQDIESVNKLISGEIPVYRTEKRYLRKNGETIWAASTITVTKRPAGQVLFFLSFVEDITFRKQAEEALLESEQRYRLLVDSSLDGVLLTNPEGDVLSANPAACQILGYTEEEIRDLGRGGIVDTSDPNLPAALEERAKAGKFRGELTLIRKDGKKFPAEVSAAVFKDKDGQPRTSMIIRDITRRKWVVERLRKSEERYRTIIETIEDAYYEVDLAGNLTFFNDAFAKLFNTPRGELTGINFRQYTDAKNARMFFEAFNRVYQTGESARDIQTEVTIKPAGEKRNVLTSVSLIRDSSGKPSGFRGISRDITGLFRIQRALKESEEKYRTIIETIEDGYYETDLAGNLTYFNDSMVRIHEYPRAELIGMNNRQYTDAENARILFKAFNRVYRTGEPSRGTYYEIITKEGGRKNLEASVSLIRDLSGKPVGFRGIARDVSELRKTQKALQESEDRYRDLVESSRDLISIHDLNGRILWVNEEPIRILGFERDFLLKMNVRDLVTFEHKEEFNNYLATIKSQGIAKGLMTLQTAKGEKRVWEYHNTLRTEGVAEPIVRSIARDVTERIQAEIEVQDTLKKLRKAMNGTIQAMALTIETRDPYTAGHQQRVADLARAIAQEMNLSEEQVDALRMSGIVHDLGKIGIPAEILSKPVQLSEIEFKLIMSHPQLSYNILKDIDFPWPVAQIVLQHHERINGSGYPFGLYGKDILLEARILAVADVVEAIASHRPYRPAHGIDKALEEISTNKGILYDPEVVDACLSLFNQKGYILKKQSTWSSFSV